MKSNKIPCQAAFNKLSIPEIPEQLKCLNRLEQVLISKRILFKKIAIMSKGQMPKIQGAICNIPVSVDETCTSLPRNVISSGIILVKLKKKMCFSGHVYFEPVSSERIHAALFAEFSFSEHNRFITILLLYKSNSVNSQNMLLT